MQRYFNVPIAFGHDVLHAKNIDDFQREVALATVAFQRVSVAGAKGIGKGFIAGLLIWWFMATRPFAKVAITSASATTVQTNIWQELATFYRKSPWLQEFFEMGDRMIRSRRYPKEHFVIARQASVRYTKGGRGKERQSEALSGMYTRHVLWVLDEATALDDVIFKTVDTSVNMEGHKLLVLFNPIRTSGFCWDIYNINRLAEGWVRFNIPFSRSSQANTPHGAAERARWVRAWGENSAWVRAFVYGEFPEGETGDTAYMPGELYEAFARVRQPDPDARLEIGIDPARHGADECVFFVQRDYVGLEMVTVGQIKQDALVDRAEALAMKWLGEEPAETEKRPNAAGDVEDFPVLSKEQKKKIRFRIDVGMGVGPIDFLRRRGYPVVAVDNGKSPSKRGRRENYASLGTELWIETREVLRFETEHGEPDEARRCALGGMLINGNRIDRRQGDQSLIQQLVQRPIVFPPNDSGRRRIMPKEQMHSNMSGSPDRGDAFVLAFCDPTRVGYVENVEDTMV